MAKADIVAEGLGFPEGPVVLPDGRISFCEQYNECMSVYDGGTTELLATTGGSPNGATLGSDDALYVAQNGGAVGDWRAPKMIKPSVQRVGLDGKVEEVCLQVNGQPLLAPNDICFGPDGRLYFTDPAHSYDPENRSEDGRIYAIGKGQEEEAVRRHPVYTNGLGFLPDGRLVWVETYERHVCVLEEGQTRELCQLPEMYLPDGFAVATDGRIFLASTYSNGISILDSDGEVLDLIKLDDHAIPTNCAFDGSVLWVTDVGMDWPTNLSGGRLWRVETDAIGMAMHKGSLQETS
jgi:gluconolactonase